MPRTHPKPAGRKPRRVQGSRPRPAGPNRRVSKVPTNSTPQQSHDQEGERLQKVLASAGIASRRQCEELIREGRVEVDGQIATELGVRVDRRTQEIRVDGEALARPRLAYYAVNKPAGAVSTARDPAGRPRVIDLLPPDVGRVFTVGRLDIESEGLILVTNDGALANQLTHPRHGVQKTYEVQVAGEPDPEVLAQLRRGVHLAEGYARAVHVRMKAKRKRSSILEMVLDEGRNREIRRLLARIGHKVQRLTRIAVGPIRLGELPRGAFRKLSSEEVRKLQAATEEGPKPVAMSRPAVAPRPTRPPRPPQRPRRDQVRAGAKAPASATSDERTPITARKVIGAVIDGVQGVTAPPRKRPVPAKAARPGGSKFAGKRRPRPGSGPGAGRARSRQK